MYAIFYCVLPGREFRAVFISTVRTVHLTSKQQQRSQLEPDWMNGVDDDDVDGSDFGFLSDQRLLNTAMTPSPRRLKVRYAS